MPNVETDDKPIMLLHLQIFLWKYAALSGGKEGSLNKRWGRAFLFSRPWLADKANQIAQTALPQENKNLAILHKCMAQRSAGEAYVEVLAALLAPPHAEAWDSPPLHITEQLSNMSFQNTSLSGSWMCECLWICCLEICVHCCLYPCNLSVFLFGLLCV